MRTKPACAAALTAVAIVMAATAGASAAPAPSYPPTPGCLKLKEVGFGGHHPILGYVNTCATIADLRPRWGLPHLGPQNPPQRTQAQPAVKMRSFIRPLGPRVVHR